MPIDFDADIAAIQRISAVPTILDVVCRATGMGFAAVARVTEDRWIACQTLDNIDFGLAAGGELKIETTICNEIREHRDIVVIDNVAEDPIYSTHHTPLMYGLQSYISVPIVLPDGRFFGTLCAIDPKPAKLNNPQILGTFRLFAQLIAYHLEADRKLMESSANLDRAHHASELRDQFIAILGHDLRNPLASIGAGSSMLLREPQTEKAQSVIALMRTSVQRMSDLIDNVLDFARGRLGGGISVQHSPDQPLEPVLLQVISEIQAANPGRLIETHLDIPRPLDVDQARIAQMFSNLLGNAITHGNDRRGIKVRAELIDDQLILSVANAGDAISPTTMTRLFQPFTRGDDPTAPGGLGLGLYIASEIAKAHGGSLAASSDSQETKFTFRMPVRT